MTNTIQLQKFEAKIITQRSNFEKKKLISLLKKKILFELENSGSVIIKNFPINNSKKQNFKSFKNFISTFGTLLKQNLKNEKIVKIEDQGKDWSSEVRGYKTNDYLNLHSDGGKLSALFCIKNSYKGGESVYVDSRKIFYSIKDIKLKKKLFKGFKYHTRNESKDKSKITKKKFPIFFFKKKKIHCMYNRKPIEEALKYENKHNQIKYLNKFEKYCLNKKYLNKFKLQPGDIWIVNNFIILHGRKKFFDSKKNKRLLLRAWLNPKKFSYSGKTLLNAYNNN